MERGKGGEVRRLGRKVDIVGSLEIRKNRPSALPGSGDLPRAAPTFKLSREEWRRRKEERREKQRAANVGRAAKMHRLRLESQKSAPPTRRAGEKPSVHVGCSGWFYWKWRGVFYPETLPTAEWFSHYARRFRTVEINASFYSWPTEANVKAWLRAAGRRRFVYTVKVCELITHVKRFKGTKSLVRDFGVVADILGERMGCFLFQLPPSYRYTAARLATIVSHLDHSRLNVVEFRHASWWNEDVFDAFRKTGTIFCSCSAPRLPDMLVRTADDIYVRFHGTKRWYRHGYSDEELANWSARVKASGAKTSWIYFNNDYNAYATRNARRLARLLR
jgi:uncharacterized protein YecE (DUF72 family)